MQYIYIDEDLSDISVVDYECKSCICVPIIDYNKENLANLDFFSEPVYEVIIKLKDYEKELIIGPSFGHIPNLTGDLWRLIHDGVSYIRNVFISFEPIKPWVVVISYIIWDAIKQNLPWETIKISLKLILKKLNAKGLSPRVELSSDNGKSIHIVHSSDEILSFLMQKKVTLKIDGVEKRIDLLEFLFVVMQKDYTEKKSKLKESPPKINFQTGPRGGKYFIDPNTGKKVYVKKS